MGIPKQACGCSYFFLVPPTTIFGRTIFIHHFSLNIFDTLSLVLPLNFPTRQNKHSHPHVLFSYSFLGTLARHTGLYIRSFEFPMPKCARSSALFFHFVSSFFLNCLFSVEGHMRRWYSQLLPFFKPLNMCSLLPLCAYMAWEDLYLDRLLSYISLAFSFLFFSI